MSVILDIPKGSHLTFFCKNRLLLNKIRSEENAKKINRKPNINISEKHIILNSYEITYDGAFSVEIMNFLTNLRFEFYIYKIF